MGPSLIGFVVGLVVGASSGTEIGAFAGGVLGAMIGFSLHAFWWLRANTGDSPTVERHRVMCTPFGHAADVEFSGDLQRGRWNDVKRCSLLAPQDEVDCDKGCLRQLTFAGVRPGKPCACQAHTETSAA